MATDDNCDPESGVCLTIPLENSIDSTAVENRELAIVYVGDPMCSWCWGISPALIKLRDHFATQHIAFKIIVGGLRPGGGQPWDERFKAFLKHHWQEVTQRSGQPFGYKLFDLEEFDYDTEPSCRAIVAARPLLGGREMEFFDAVQRKFYVDSEDPRQPEFYRSICSQLEIDFGEFETRFSSEKVRKETFAEFNLNREWGVQGYPCVLLEEGGAVQPVSYGYASYETMKNEIENLAKKQS